MAANEGPDKIFTPAERIRKLNEIDQDVVKLLNSAGLAVKALTNSSSATSAVASNHVPTIQSHRDIFSGSAASYFSLLQSISVRMRRQVYALEEAGIISPEAPPKEMNSQSTSATASSGVPNITSSQNSSSKGTTASGGLGNLDVDWLNSRNDDVERRKEAELWGQAREYLEKLEQREYDEHDDPEPVEQSMDIRPG